MLLQVCGDTVATSSADGMIKVYQARDCRLCPVFESENVKSTSGVRLSWRHIRSLEMANHIVYYGDDGMNIKALDWKLGRNSEDLDAMEKKLPSNIQTYSSPSLSGPSQQRPASYIAPPQKKKTKNC